MEIRYKDIVLRDARESDIEDEIRWNTVETQWALWDAPWEMEEEIARFNPEAYRARAMAELAREPEGFRWHFELDTAEGVHIGGVNAYLIDGSYDWIAEKDVRPGQPVYAALGIEIEESAYWSRGLGTRALEAFALYFMENGRTDLYLQTWSGNTRMVRCAKRLGFVICRRKPGIRHVRGVDYDGLTFRLDADAFRARLT